MQLRYLKSFALYRVTKQKQPNGSYLDTETLIRNYECSINDLTDDISSSIYGATINRMLRISSVRQELEKYLQERLTTVSDYVVKNNGHKYKCVSVKNNWVDIEIV